MLIQRDIAYMVTSIIRTHTIQTLYYTHYYCVCVLGLKYRLVEKQNAEKYDYLDAAIGRYIKYFVVPVKYNYVSHFCNPNKQNNKYLFYCSTNKFYFF